MESLSCLPDCLSNEDIVDDANTMLARYSIGLHIHGAIGDKNMATLIPKKIDRLFMMRSAIC